MNQAKNHQQQQVHVVVFPYPGQGHINPLMQLSIRLASSLDCFVTFVTCRGNHKSITESWAKQGIKPPSEEQGLTLRMASIPDDVLPPRSMGKIFEFIQGTKKLREAFEEFMAGLMDDPTFPRVTCIVSDSVLNWVSDVSQSFGVHWSPYFPLPASSFLLQHHAPSLAEQGILPVRDDDVDKEVVRLPGLVPLHPLELPPLANIEGASEAMINAPWVLINTCETLEYEALEAAKREGYNVVPVAPLLPASFVDNGKGGDGDSAFVTSSLWEQDGTCLEWLDLQSPSSVLYVSFGSIAGMLCEDLEKLLSGIVRSGVPFLWVLRRELILGLTQEKHERFLKMAKDHQGLIVEWTTQLKVLLHPSVAVFLTHCGWNSTFESICAGVPMICWPCFADQKTNAKYIVDVWKVGVKVANRYVLTGNVSEDDVEGVVKDMMKGEKGREMKERVVKLSNACKDEFAGRNGLKAFSNALLNIITDSY